MTAPSVPRNVAAYGILASLLLSFLAASVLVHPRKLLRPIKATLRAMFKVFGVRVTVSGLERLDPSAAYLYMVNHVSAYDHFLLLAYLPGYMVGLEKVEASRVPVYGWAARRWGQVHVDRDDHASGVAACREAGARLAQGVNVVVFPEGTRSLDGKLGPLKKGGFHIAADTGATVVPIALRGMFPLAPKGSKLIGQGDVEVRVGRPIAPGSGDHEALRERVEGDLRAMLAAAAPR